MTMTTQQQDARSTQQPLWYMVWYEWYGIIWPYHGMVYGMVWMVWYMVWYEWYGIIWPYHGMVYGMVWMVWYMVWYYIAMVWYDSTSGVISPI